jgi:hypothetical protein
LFLFLLPQRVQNLMVLPRPELQFGGLAIQELAETRAEGFLPHGGGDIVPYHPLV